MASRHLGILEEPVVGGGESGTMILVHGPMEVVGATLGHQYHLGPRSSAFVGISAGGRHSEFLERVQSRPQGALKCKPLDWIIVVHAVNRDVGLITASTGHRAAAAVFSLRHRLIVVSRVSHAWLQTENSSRVSAFKREALDLDGVERMS